MEVQKSLLAAEGRNLIEGISEAHISKALFHRVLACKPGKNIKILVFVHSRKNDDPFLSFHSFSEFRWTKLGLRTILTSLAQKNPGFLRN